MEKSLTTYIERLVSLDEQNLRNLEFLTQNPNKDNKRNKKMTWSWKIMVSSWWSCGGRFIEERKRENEKFASFFDLEWEVVL